MVLAGVRAAITEPGRTDVLISLVLCSGMALVCVYDARRIARPLADATPLVLFFTWPVAIPIYLVWSRGWKRGILLGMVFVGSLALLWLVPFVVAGYAARGPAFFKTG